MIALRMIRTVDSGILATVQGVLCAQPIQDENKHKQEYDGNHKKNDRHTGEFINPFYWKARRNAASATRVQIIHRVHRSEF